MADSGAILVALHQNGTRVTDEEREVIEDRLEVF